MFGAFVLGPLVYGTSEEYFGTIDLSFWQYGFGVKSRLYLPKYKIGSNLMKRVTIWILDIKYRNHLGVLYSNGKVMWLDIMDNKQAFSVHFSDPHSNTGPIWQTDTNLPFENLTSPVFRWLLYKFERHLLDPAATSRISDTWCGLIGLAFFLSRLWRWWGCCSYWCWWGWGFS